MPNDQASGAGGGLLYNGIRLPAAWPPHGRDAQVGEPPRVPYLQTPPAVIPIDLGRQLFVDEFLIETTTLRRVFHRPEPFAGNPVLQPETALERNGGEQPVACPFSDGVFYDPADRLFKLWYMAGWFDGTALAYSPDGVHWERPAFDVVPGTNQVLAPRPDFRRDGTGLWLDQDAADPAERYKLLLYARSATSGTGGRLFTSPDGIHWQEHAAPAGLTQVGDNSTLFYNPFRKRWVLSARETLPGHGRVRYYREHADFLQLGSWRDGGPVFWVGADRLDRPDPETGEATQMYKVDAVAYESILLGLLQVHYGPPNEVCERGGFPKLTELTLAYSRDGFHWDRRDRQIFIGASRRAGRPDRAYIHSAGGVCLIVGDHLYFYYGGFSGVSPRRGGDIYAGGSTNLAILRRDGFVSLDAGAAPGSLVTRPVHFSGRHLFVNLAAAQGELRAEVLDRHDRAIPPFSLENCLPLHVDQTAAPVSWRGQADLSAIAGQIVKFRFQLTNGSLYAFWVSPDRTGASNGYVAAGGPGFRGPADASGTSA